MKTEERIRARELRSEGRSIKEIERLLGVARSSVSLWVRDVPLTDAQRRALATRVGKGKVAAGRTRSERARRVRAAYQAEGRLLARERGASYAAGCMLYWAEGGKRRNSVLISNSDPALLRLFTTFLREHFNVPNEQFRIECNLFADHLARQREVEQHWLDALELPAECLRKSTVNVYSKYSQKKRSNKLPYGTSRVQVHSTKIVQTIYGSIQELGGFERPEWLD